MIDWETTTGAILRPFDDGHTPEGLIGLSTDDEHSSTTQLAVYPPETLPRPQVHVLDDAVDPVLTQAWYDTMIASEKPSWGAYVTMEEIGAAWQQQQQLQQQLQEQRSETRGKAGKADCDATTQETIQEPSDLRQNLSLHLAATLVQQIQLLSDGDATAASQSWHCDREGNNDKQHLLPSIHGVAVWALRSSVGASVPYHMDYAEQLRYERNWIVPPVWGGILQCTPSVMEGGDYYVYLPTPGDGDGYEASVDHYATHGYKAKREQPSLLDEPNATRITIPYRCNRLIAQAGYLPHGSTQLTSLAPVAARIVVGLNIFLNDAGPFVQARPEHSPAFDAWVAALRQSRAQQGRRVDLHKLLKANPKVARRLLQAQRKKEFVQALEVLKQSVLEAVRIAEPDGVTVQDLQDALARTDGRYPSADDIAVYLSHHTGSGLLYRAVLNDSDGTAMATVASERLLSSRDRIRSNR